jgi:RNA polymerase sigma-70 factor (sigma-E family)
LFWAADRHSPGVDGRLHMQPPQWPGAFYYGMDDAVERAERIEGGRLADLYTLHAAGAARLAYLLTGDQGLAQDLTQEAFLRLFGRFLHVRDPIAFDAYLRRMIINLANSHFRRARVERRSLERHAVMRRASAPEVDIGASDELRRALLGLPRRQRAAIVLRFYEDLSEAQTAEILRCAPGTVKSLVSRGMERLREAIGRSEI